MTTTHVDPAEAKRIRAARNRESARRSRELAKERNQRLEENFRSVTKENNELKEQLCRFTDEYVAIQAQVALSGNPNLQSASEMLLERYPVLVRYFSRQNEAVVSTP